MIFLTSVASLQPEEALFRSSMEFVMASHHHERLFLFTEVCLCSHFCLYHLVIFNEPLPKDHFCWKPFSVSLFVSLSLSLSLCLSVSVSLCVSLSLCPHYVSVSVSLSLSLSVSLSLSLSVCLCLFALSMSLSLSLSLSLSFTLSLCLCLSLYVSVSVSLCLSVCLCLSVSFSLSLSFSSFFLGWSLIRGLSCFSHCLVLLVPEQLYCCCPFLSVCFRLHNSVANTTVLLLLCLRNTAKVCY